MSLGTTYSPTVPVGGATSYKSDQCLHIDSNGYLEVYRRFQRDFLIGGGVQKEGDALGELSLWEFIMGEENFHEGSAGFSSII